MNQIAIIGFGWLGTALGTTLTKKGFQVVGSTTSPDKLELLKENHFDAFLLDTSNILEEELRNRFKTIDIAVLTIPPSRDAAVDNYTYGDSLRKIAQLFPENTRFIYTSSTTVYHDDIPLATEADLDRSKYRDSDPVVYAEEVLDAYLGERLTIVRLAGLIGGGRHIGKYFAGRKQVPQGTSPVNLIHQKDCVGLISTIIEKEAFGDIFNACASMHPSRGAYYTAYCGSFGLEEPTFNMDPSQAITKTISNQKSKDSLGYTYLLDDPFLFFQEP